MTKLKLLLDTGKIIRMYGPATVRVVSGQVMVLGAVFNPGDEFTISRYRSYAVKSLVDSILDIELMEGGSIEEPLPGEEPLDFWVAQIDSLLRKEHRTFMVLGPTDSGKSSIAVLIANRALLRGLLVGIVDADVGQADIGLPGFITAGKVSKPILWLRELDPWKMRFVGYITPSRAEKRIVGAVVDLVWKLRGSNIDVVVIDTDGWVQGINSIEYKLEAAHYSGVDSVVVVGDRELYRMVMHALKSGKFEVVYLPTPQVKRVRDKGDRRVLRSERYKAFFKSATTREIALDKVSILGSCFFMGSEITSEELGRIQRVIDVPVEAASETHDTVYIITVGQPSMESIAKLREALGKDVYVLDKNIMRGALVAVLCEDNEECAAGLLEDIDFKRGVIRVKTRYEGDIKGLFIGGTRLSEEYTEVGRPLRCAI
jgi:polynucleotide 5'-hydroxyl-kinase GRC3/NOL9